jgi:hypothetical protein
MRLVYRKKKAREVINRCFKVLGISLSMKTDPDIIREVLEEMRLDGFDTRFKPVQDFFQAARKQPQPLRPLLEMVSDSIIRKHHGVIEFVEIALKNGWLSRSPHIIYSLHVLYIHEALTSAMCNNHSVFISVHNHYKAQEKALGLDMMNPLRTFLLARRISSDSFKIAKAFSLDPLMVYSRILKGLSKSRIRKDELRRMYRRNQINYIEYRLLVSNRRQPIGHILKLVRINIYEAGITEYQNGFKSNSLCAHELSEFLKINAPQTLFEKERVYPEKEVGGFSRKVYHKGNKFPTIEVDQDWASLYTTWNMAFILGNLTDLDLIFPKLLLPTLLDSKPENFLGVRFISLWLAINHVIFRKSRGKEIKGPRNKKQMAKEWGKINERYAFYSGQYDIHQKPEVLISGYDAFFSHPLWNFSKLVWDF